MQSRQQSMSQAPSNMPRMMPTQQPILPKPSIDMYTRYPNNISTDHRMVRIMSTCSHSNRHVNCELFTSRTTRHLPWMTTYNNNTERSSNNIQVQGALDLRVSVIVDHTTQVTQAHLHLTLQWDHHYELFLKVRGTAVKDYYYYYLNARLPAVVILW